jgi:hypothetical protein
MFVHYVKILHNVHRMFPAGLAEVNWQQALTIMQWCSVNAAWREELIPRHWASVPMEIDSGVD